jgi:hypothetical protein
LKSFTLFPQAKSHKAINKLILIKDEQALPFYLVAVRDFHKKVAIL